MKKLILLLLLIPLVSFGQDEKSTNKIITDSFVENYNSEDYKAIFSMFSDEMKDALPIDKTSEFLILFLFSSFSIDAYTKAASLRGFSSVSNEKKLIQNR